MKFQDHFSEGKENISAAVSFSLFHKVEPNHYITILEMSVVLLTFSCMNKQQNKKCDVIVLYLWMTEISAENTPWILPWCVHHQHTSSKLKI